MSLCCLRYDRLLLQSPPLPYSNNKKGISSSFCFSYYLKCKGELNLLHSLRDNLRASDGVYCRESQLATSLAFLFVLAATLLLVQRRERDGWHGGVFCGAHTNTHAPALANPNHRPRWHHIVSLSLRRSLSAIIFHSSVQHTLLLKLTWRRLEPQARIASLKGCRFSSLSLSLSLALSLLHPPASFCEALEATSDRR